MRILLLLALGLVVGCTLFPKGHIADEMRQFIMGVLEGAETTEGLLSAIGHTTPKTPTCTGCHIAMAGLQKLPHKTALKILSAIATQFCVMKKIEDNPVCKGAVSEMINYIVTNAWAHYFDPHLACHKIKLCPKEYDIVTVADYAKDVLADNPHKTQEQPTNRKIIKVLHITDLHPDLFYTEGTPAVCGEPVCCRTDVSAKNGSFAAGFWGSNAECDVPLRTFNLFLEHIKSEQLDLVLWTGDNTAHDIWKQSQSYNLNFTVLLTDLMKAKFNVPVIPALGNHESYPVNVYEWGKGNSIELNDGVAEAWQDWIGPEATKVLKEKGYFSTYLPKLNLKVVALNTQAGNDENWVLLKNPTDPGQHLEWLRKQLTESEKLKQLVYIIGHIPPLDNVDEWGSRFNLLVERFSYIIRGQFYGHTHNDHLSFFTASNDTTRKIINNYLVAPSFTTSTDRNPRYRILKVDVDTMRVVDYDQYKLNLKRNWTKDQTPVFELDYSLLKEYNLSNFGFAEQARLRGLLENDNATQIKYTFHQYGGIKAGTTGKGIGCGTRTTRTLQAECMGAAYKPVLLEKIAGPWRVLRA